MDERDGEETSTERGGQGGYGRTFFLWVRQTHSHLARLHDRAPFLRRMSCSSDLSMTCCNMFRQL